MLTVSEVLKELDAEPPKELKEPPLFWRKPFDAILKLRRLNLDMKETFDTVSEFYIAIERSQAKNKDGERKYLKSPLLFKDFSIR